MPEPALSLESPDVSGKAVTVAVPTYNRAPLLRQCLDSVVAQDVDELSVLVLDNASDDETRAVVASFRDQRLAYEPTPLTIGMVRNWNRAIDRNTSPYLCVFGDDDVMLPGFLRESVQALAGRPAAGFSFTSVDLIDAEGMALGSQEAGDVPAGACSGLDYLERVVMGRRVVINPSAVVMRRSALEQAGRFSSPHSSHTFDFNLYLRLAWRHEVVHLPRQLVRVRVHAGQHYQAAWRVEGATGPFSDAGERMDAATYLLESPRAAASAYRQWLASRVRSLNAARSELALSFVPDMHSWEDRVLMAVEDIIALVPEGATLILVDDNHWVGYEIPHRRTIPFLERDGAYWGPPPDSGTGIREVERLREAGARFLIFAWPAFWWLSHYHQLRSYLDSNYRCMLENDRIVGFDLDQATSDHGAVKDRS